MSPAPVTSSGSPVRLLAGSTAMVREIWSGAWLDVAQLLSIAPTTSASTTRPVIAVLRRGEVAAPSTAAVRAGDDVGHEATDLAHQRLCARAVSARRRDRIAKQRGAGPSRLGGLFCIRQ